MKSSRIFLLGLGAFGLVLLLALLPAWASRLNAAPAAATVNVAHFAPFGSDLASTSVTVKVTGEGVDAELEAVQFSDIAQNIDLPSGIELTIQILPTGTDTVAIEGTATLENGLAYTLAAIGDGTNQPLELLPLVNETATATDTAKLRIGHLAPFAADVAATAVDICTDSGVIILADVAYKDVTAYGEFAPGDYDLSIALAGTECAAVALDLPSIRLNAGEIYDLFAIGLPENRALPLQAATTTGLDLSPARVNIAHVAPFAPDPADTGVTIRINGAEALSDIAYGEPAVAAELPAGEELLIEVAPDILGQAAISTVVTLEPGAEYTLLATGDNDNQPLELIGLADATPPPTAGAGKIRIGHLAPFTADLAESRVDICLDGGGPVPGLTSVAYGAITPEFIELPAGDYDLLVALADTNCAEVVLDLPSIRLSAGDIKDVYAIGKNSAAYPLATYSVLGLNLTPSLVNIAHYAPFSDTAETTSVAILANGVELARDVRYGDKITDFEAQPGTYVVEIAVPSEALNAGDAVDDADVIFDTVVISQEVTIAPESHYTVIAAGDNANQPLAILLLEDERDAPPAGSAKLRLGHLAPFAAELDATRVDICTEENAAVLNDVPYGAITAPYLVLPEGAYDLKIAIAGTGCATTAIDIPAFQLASGDIADAYAIGTGTGDFPLTVDSITGLREPPTAIDDNAPDFVPGEESRLFLPLIVR